MDNSKLPSTGQRLSENSIPESTETPGKTVSRAEELKNKAEELKNKGQVDNALKILNNAANLEPVHAEIYLARAEIYKEMGQYQPALADLDRAIDLKPDNALIYSQRGEIYRLLKRPKEALADLNQAISLDPKNPLILGRRGIVYRHLKESAKSLADFNAALLLDPTNTWLYGNRAEAYRTEKNYQEAVNDYNRILKLNPDLTWVYERKAIPDLWLNDLQAAQLDFERSWQLNPVNLMNGWMAEWVMMCQEDFSFSPAAGERLKSLAERAQYHHIGYLCRASLYWFQGLFGKSYEEAERAHEIALDEPGTYFWKGMAIAGVGRDEEALVLFQQALELKMPPVLLLPLRWTAQAKPLFYERYARPLLASLGLPNIKINPYQTGPASPQIESGPVVTQAMPGPSRPPDTAGVADSEPPVPYEKPPDLKMAENTEKGVNASSPPVTTTPVDIKPSEQTQEIPRLERIAATTILVEETLKPRPALKQKPVTEPQPVTEQKSTPEPQFVAETKPVTEPQPVTEQKSTPEPKPVTEAKSTPVPEKKTIPAPEHISVREAQPGAKQKPVTEAKSTPKLGAVTEAKSTPKPGAVTEAKSTPKPGAVTGTKTLPESEAKTISTPLPKPVSEIKPASEVKPASGPKPGLEQKTKPAPVLTPLNTGPVAPAKNKPAPGRAAAAATLQTANSSKNSTRLDPVMRVNKGYLIRLFLWGMGLLGAVVLIFAILTSQNEIRPVTNNLSALSTVVPASLNPVTSPDGSASSSAPVNGIPALITSVAKTQGASTQRAAVRNPSPVVTATRVPATPTRITRAPTTPTSIPPAATATAAPDQVPLSLLKTQPLTGHTGPITTASWTKDGRYYATGALDNTIKVWDSTTNKETITLSPKNKTASGAPLALAWSNDSRYIVSAWADNNVRFFSVLPTNVKNPDTAGQILFEATDNILPEAVAIASDASLIPYPGKDMLHTKTYPKNANGPDYFLGGNNRVLALGFSPDNRYLAAGLADGRVLVWDRATLKVLLTILPDQSAGANPVTRLDWTSDMQYLLIGSQKTFNAYHITLSNGGKVLDIPISVNLKSPVTALKSDSTAKQLAFGSQDGDLQLWSLEQKKLVEQQKTGTGPLLEIVFSNDSKQISVVKGGNQGAVLTYSGVL